jgi:hypothetical protein
MKRATQSMRTTYQREGGGVGATPTQPTRKIQPANLHTLALTSSTTQSESDHESDTVTLIETQRDSNKRGAHTGRELEIGAR